MAKYVVSKEGKEIGPLTLSDVISKITARELELFDYVYDENRKDWILLTEHQDITAALKAQKPKAPPAAAQKPEPVSQASSPVVEKTHSVEWFVMKGQSQFGPFSKGDIIRMMQERAVYEFDFIWNASMKDWARLAEVQEFSAQAITDLYKSKSEKGSFLDRKHARQKFEGKILVHNNDEVWVADGKEISAGGLGLYISNALIVPGQQVYLHVRGVDGREPFNVIGEVVSKKFSKDASSRNNRIEYGVRFVEPTKANLNLKAAG